MGGWLGSALLGSLYSPLKLLNSARIRPIFFADLALVLFPVLLCNKQFQRLRDSRGGLEGVWTMVCDWQAVLAAARSVPSGSASPSLCHSIFPSPGRQDTGRRRQASGPSQAAGDQPALPASGTDQAACERRDSCSCLKYAGYFYLPTSGGEGHPTSGRGGCYTMFPFSREGKWREARLPDHMVLKSMKKN